MPPSFPKSLLVVGSGAIGIEFASFYRTLGAEVTVVEVLDRVLPVEDEEISAFAAKAFTKQGMKLKVGTTVEKLKKGADNVTATLKAKDGKTETLTVDRVILADRHRRQCREYRPGSGRHQGRQDPCRRRSNGARPASPGVWAIGDLVGAPWLAHKAMHEGVIVAETHRRRERRASARYLERAGLHLLLAAGGERRHDRSQGEGDRPQDQGRPLPLHRQRQGHRAGRGGRPGQDGVRRRDRRASGRAYDRRGSDRTDPGLCHRQDRRTDRRGTGAHHLPASRRCRK